MVPRPQPAPLKLTVGSGSVLFSEKRLAEYRKQRAHGPQNKGTAKLSRDTHLWFLYRRDIRVIWYFYTRWVIITWTSMVCLFHGDYGPADPAFKPDLGSSFGARGWSLDAHLLRNARNIGEAEAIERHLIRGENISWCEQGYAWVQQDAITSRRSCSSSSQKSYSARDRTPIYNRRPLPFVVRSMSKKWLFGFPNPQTGLRMP